MAIITRNDKHVVEAVSKFNGKLTAALFCGIGLNSAITATLSDLLGLSGYQRLISTIWIDLPWMFSLFGCIVLIALFRKLLYTKSEFL